MLLNNASLETPAINGVCVRCKAEPTYLILLPTLDLHEGDLLCDEHASGLDSAKVSRINPPYDCCDGN